MLQHSLETHHNLVAKIPAVTGRHLPEWFKALEEGPAFLRFEDRVHWLREEHGLSHGHATAIIHEHDKLRGLRHYFR